MRYAIIIACEEYHELPVVSFAFADAEEIQSTLTEYCDYALQNITYLQLFPGWEDSPTSIFNSLEPLFSKIEKEDTLFFYFAGHGYKAGDKGYLVLPDSTLDRLAETAIDIRVLNNEFQNLGCNSFLFFDACHSGIQARAAQQPNSFIDTIPEDTGCMTFAACSENELSYPDAKLEHGIFTYYLCEEIKKAEINSDILLERLKLSVCSDVTDWAMRSGKAQTPTLLGKIVGNVSIATRNDKVYDGKTEAIEDETLTLLDGVAASWLRKEYCLFFTKNREINKDWRVFGRLRVHEAVSKCDDAQWLVLFSLAEKFNHSNLLHSFSNLHEIRKYYAGFGTESQYRYLQLIVLKNQEACKLVDKVLMRDTKIRKYWKNRNVQSIILYLHKGTLIEYKNNIATGQ